MTNKPMLSVERELLEVIDGFISSQADAFPIISVPRGLRSDGLDQVSKELRALLDKQSCGACNGCANGCKLDRESPQVEPALESQYAGMTQDQKQAVSDGVDEILHGEPAAQHQGEPVAFVIDIESAAKKLAQCMDYPWEYMPEQGRQSMREHAKAVVEASRLNGVKP